MNEWISVEDRMPINTDNILAFNGYGGVGEYDIMYYTVHSKIHKWAFYYDYDRSEEIVEITHWMPLPEPPKEKK